MADGTRFKQLQETFQHQIDGHEEALQEVRGRLDQLTDLLRTIIAQ